MSVVSRCNGDKPLSEAEELFYVMYVIFYIKNRITETLSDHNKESYCTLTQSTIGDNEIDICMYIAND